MCVYILSTYIYIYIVQGQYLDIALKAREYKIYCPAKAFDLPMQSVTCISYNMGKRDLPDIYALARGRGHIYQEIPIAHVISDIYHLSIYHVREIKKNLNPQLKLYSLARLQIHLLSYI